MRGRRAAPAPATTTLAQGSNGIHPLLECPARRGPALLRPRPGDVRAPPAASDPSVVTDDRPSLSRSPAWVPGAPEGRTRPRGAQRRPDTIQPRERPGPPVTADVSAGLPSSLPLPRCPAGSPEALPSRRTPGTGSSEQQATRPGAEQLPVLGGPQGSAAFPLTSPSASGAAAAASGTGEAFEGRSSSEASGSQSPCPGAGAALLSGLTAAPHTSPAPPGSVGCLSSQGPGEAGSRKGDSRDWSRGLWASVGSSHS